MSNPNDSLYAVPRRNVDWYPRFRYTQNRLESAPDVIDRLKRECGAMFVAGWKAHCDQETGGGRGSGTYDPQLQPQLASRFLAGLRFHHCDIRDLCWASHLWVDWDAVWDMQLAHNRERDHLRTHGKGHHAPPRAGKGADKRPVDPGWSTSSSSRHRNEPGSSQWARR